MEAGTEAAFALAVSALLALVAISTARAGLVLQRYIPERNILLGLPDNALRILGVIVCFVIGVTLGPGSRALGWSTEHILRNFAVGALFGFAMSLCIGLGARVAVALWGPQVVSTRMVQCMLPADRGEWVGVLAAMLPAALLEELLFRSLPLGGLGWLVSPWALLWPLSLLFGLMHWPQGGWGVAGATFVGVLLSFLFLGSGSLWAALAAHYVLNVHQLVTAHRAGLVPLRAERPATPEAPVILP